MGGKDDSDAGAENIKANIHKFWFMKIPRGSTVYDDGVNVGLGDVYKRQLHFLFLPWFDIANYTRFSIFRQCPLKCLLLFFSKIYTKKKKPCSAGLFYFILL